MAPSAAAIGARRVSMAAEFESLNFMNWLQVTSLIIPALIFWTQDSFDDNKSRWRGEGRVEWEPRAMWLHESEDLLLSTTAVSPSGMSDTLYSVSHSPVISTSVTIYKDKPCIQYL